MRLITELVGIYAMQLNRVDGALRSRLSAAMPLDYTHPTNRNLRNETRYDKWCVTLALTHPTKDILRQFCWRSPLIFSR